MKKPCLIGLTGGIASGKSLVGKLLEQERYPVYSSDTRAKELVTENPVLKSQIIQLLGPEAYLEDGTYHRTWVARKVFSKPDLLSALNNLIHPAVKQDFDSWLEQQTAELVFKETALLFELNLDKQTDFSLLVTAEEEIRIQRAMQRDGRTREEVEHILSRQMPEAEKEARADVVLRNNGSLQELEGAVQAALEKLGSLCRTQKLGS